MRPARTAVSKAMAWALKELSQKKVRWRVHDYADGWIYYDTEEEARASDEAQNGALVECATEQVRRP
jgi:hypothetical protein